MLAQHNFIVIFLNNSCWFNYSYYWKFQFLLSCSLSIFVMISHFLHHLLSHFLSHLSDICIAHILIQTSSMKDLSESDFKQLFKRDFYSQAHKYSACRTALRFWNKSDKFTKSIQKRLIRDSWSVLFESFNFMLNFSLNDSSSFFIASKIMQKTKIKKASKTSKFELNKIITNQLKKLWMNEISF